MDKHHGNVSFLTMYTLLTLYKRAKMVYLIKSGRQKQNIEKISYKKYKAFYEKNVLPLR